MIASANAPDSPEKSSITVAIDVGPLHGRRTGVGNAVGWTVDALEHEPSLHLLPYVTSMRARVTSPVRRLPIPASLAHRWWAHRSPPLDRLLGRPDVVHGTNYVVPPTRCARVVSVYDCWFLDHPDDTLPDVRRSGQVLRRSVDDGATVVASSEATAVRVRDLLGTDRVRTVLLGPPPSQSVVEPPNRRPIGLPDPGGDPFVLAIATIERRKNTPRLIDAFGRVALEHETARLVIAGAPGDDSAAVQRAIDRLDASIASRVVRLGPVSDDAKRWLLANARVLAYPSLDEGFGFPILEAQMANLAVVTSSAGSIPEIAGRGALLSPATDTDALAANLFWVLNDDAIRTKLIRRGHRNVERFSWRETARQLAALYADLTTGATS